MNQGNQSRIPLRHSSLIRLPLANPLQIAQNPLISRQSIREEQPRSRQREHVHDIGRCELLPRQPCMLRQAIVQDP